MGFFLQSFINRCTKNGVSCFFSLSNVFRFDFLGNSTNNICVFKIQKQAIRIIMGAKNRDSCKEFFKLLKISKMYEEDGINSDPVSCRV